jgi:hypothetical protein
VNYNKDIIFGDRVEVIGEVDDTSVVSSLDVRNSFLGVIDIISLESPSIMKSIIKSNPLEQEKEVKLPLDAIESKRESLVIIQDVKLEDNSSIALESNLYII